MATIKKILKIIVIAFLGISLVIGMYNYFNQEKILSIAVDSLNNHLTAEVSVDNIELSPFSNWPYVSVKFETVKIASSIEFKNDLLRCGTCSGDLQYLSTAKAPDRL